MKLEEGTVDLTKEYHQPVAAVFAAWSQEEAQRQWGHPGPGWHMDFDRFSFAAGGTDICRFGPEGGDEYLNENRYLEIEPEHRIVYATSLRSNGVLTFAGTVTVAFDSHDDGTRMRLVEQGLYFDGHDSVEGHREGWQHMLTSIEAWLDGKAK
ncbi:MAG: SRPBCC domain-containing protein [Aquamicrobium sp.]|nr:SRPBCC domain-containing protein [Aquamicrobium sp.]